MENWYRFIKLNNRLNLSIQLGEHHPTLTLAALAIRSAEKIIKDLQ